LRSRLAKATPAPPIRSEAITTKASLRITNHPLL
jgi:hypothetical protein